MKIQTSYFANLKNVINPISVAGGCPEFYRGPQYKKLAPKYTWWKEWHDNKLSEEWYIEQYHKTVLCALDPKLVIADLFSFYPDADVITLLCWERPGQFCHRHLIGKWLQNTIADLSVMEL